MNTLSMALAAATLAVTGWSSAQVLNDETRNPIVRMSDTQRAVIEGAADGDIGTQFHDDWIDAIEERGDELEGYNYYVGLDNSGGTGSADEWTVLLHSDADEWMAHGVAGTSTWDEIEEDFDDIRPLSVNASTVFWGANQKPVYQLFLTTADAVELLVAPMTITDGLRAKINIAYFGGPAGTTGEPDNGWYFCWDVDEPGVRLVGEFTDGDFTEFDNSATPSSITWNVFRTNFVGLAPVGNDLNAYFIGDLDQAGHGKQYVDLTIDDDDIDDIVNYTTLGDIPTALHARLIEAVREVDIGTNGEPFSDGDIITGPHRSWYQHTLDMGIRDSSDDWRFHGYSQTFQYSQHDGITPDNGSYAQQSWTNLEKLYGLDEGHYDAFWNVKTEVPCVRLLITDDEFDDLFDVTGPDYTHDEWDDTTLLSTLATRIVNSASNVVMPWAMVDGSDPGEWFVAWEIGSDPAVMALWKASWNASGMNIDWKRLHVGDALETGCYTNGGPWSGTDTSVCYPSDTYAGWRAVEPEMGDVP